MSDDREPVGTLDVEREKGDVRLRIEADGEADEYYLPPERAAQVAMWLQQAAADAKEWERQEGSR